MMKASLSSLTIAASLAVLGSASCDQGDPIAPNCEGSVCAEAEVDASLSCEDEILQISFEMTSQISGVVAQTSCGIEDVDGGQDLEIEVGPVDPSATDQSYVVFRLRGYKGPGTYPLKQLEADGNYKGLEIHGNNNVPAGVGNPDNSVGTVFCKPVICEATVAEGSETIPNDPSSTHDFRLRVDIACPAGGILTDFGECNDPPEGTTCTLDAAPTLKLDVVCSN